MISSKAFTIFLLLNNFPFCLSIATRNIFADDNMVSVNGKSIVEVETLLHINLRNGLE